MNEELAAEAAEMVEKVWLDGFAAGRRSAQPAPEPDYGDATPPEGYQAGPSE